jgi:hypothetical protein
MDTLTKAIKLTTLAGKIKRIQAPLLQRKIASEIHIKQFEETEKSIIDHVSPLFQIQIQSASENLKNLSGKSPSSSLASLIFNPDEWNKELVNRALPPIAVGMIEAMNAQFNLMGFENNKQTTGSEFLEEEDDSDLAEIVFITALGAVALSALRNKPQWMKNSIESRLRETFAQPYWKEINRTTLRDIEKFLDNGIRRGQSIDHMARNITSVLDDKYALRRAQSIAMTEPEQKRESMRWVLK